MSEKNAKITKQCHAFKDYASSYCKLLQMLKSWVLLILTLQLKDIESTAKNKLIDI